MRRREPSLQAILGDCGTGLGDHARDPGQSPKITSSTSKVHLATEQLDGAPTDGERKTVAALFADIRGSTKLMEDFDPEERLRLSTRR